MMLACPTFVVCLPYFFELLKLHLFVLSFNQLIGILSLLFIYCLRSSSSTLFRQLSAIIIFLQLSIYILVVVLVQQQWQYCVESSGSTLSYHNGKLTITHCLNKLEILKTCYKQNKASYTSTSTTTTLTTDYLWEQY